MNENSWKVEGKKKKKKKTFRLHATRLYRVLTNRWAWADIVRDAILIDMKLLLSKSPPFLAVEDCSKTSNHLPFCPFFLSVHVYILRERFELLMPKGWGMRYHVGDSLPGRSCWTVSCLPGFKLSWIMRCFQALSEQRVDSAWLLKIRLQIDTYYQISARTFPKKNRVGSVYTYILYGFICF